MFKHRIIIFMFLIIVILITGCSNTDKDHASRQETSSPETNPESEIRSILADGVKISELPFAEVIHEKNGKSWSETFAVNGTDTYYILKDDLVTITISPFGGPNLFCLIQTADDPSDGEVRCIEINRQELSPETFVGKMVLQIANKHSSLCDEIAKCDFTDAMKTDEVLYTKCTSADYESSTFELTITNMAGGQSIDKFVFFKPDILRNDTYTFSRERLHKELDIEPVSIDGFREFVTSHLDGSSDEVKYAFSQIFDQ